MREALKVGRRLTREGVLGRFALDFVTVRNDARRVGGLRHRDQPAQGRDDASVPDAAVPDRRPLRRRRRACSRRRAASRKCFVASDHLHSPRYRAFTHDDLFDIVARHGLHFDQSRQTGVVFHMMNGVGEQGTLGLTAVGDTPAEADALYRKTAEVLDAEAAKAMAIEGPGQSERLELRLVELKLLPPGGVSQSVA